MAPWFIENDGLYSPQILREQQSGSSECDTCRAGSARTRRV